ncbi:MAG TPA: PIG-L family deacetylase [Armatimonadota bacterium]|nr:PIG-L family deacetylase [Armatimonadota bacterium]
MSSDAYDIGVMVAHPDDEVLWCGGLLLAHPEWRARIGTLCRAGDPDRAPRFREVLARLGADGGMRDADDGPEQAPLAAAEVRAAVLALLGEERYDLLLTHGPAGEYTRHRRHEEVSRAVTALWLDGRLRARRLWLFAYEDGRRRYLPRPDAGAHRCAPLPPAVWREKSRLIREVYGFAGESWEARAAPRAEAFWCFDAPDALGAWLAHWREMHEGAGAL